MNDYPSYQQKHLCGILFFSWSAAHMSNITRLVGFYWSWQFLKFTLISCGFQTNVLIYICPAAVPSSDNLRNVRDSSSLWGRSLTSWPRVLSANVLLWAASARLAPHLVLIRFFWGVKYGLYPASIHLVSIFSPPSTAAAWAFLLSTLGEGGRRSAVQHKGQVWRYVFVLVRACVCVCVLCFRWLRLGPAAWTGLANHEDRWYVGPLALLNERKWGLFLEASQPSWPAWWSRSHHSASVSCPTRQHLSAYSCQHRHGVCTPLGKWQPSTCPSQSQAWMDRLPLCPLQQRLKQP